MKNEVNYGTKETLYVLSKIEDLRKIAPRQDLLRYIIENLFGEDKIQKKLSSAKEDEILSDLERWGAFKIHREETIKDNNERIYYLDLDYDKFKEVYSDHVKLSQENTGSKHRIKGRKMD